MEDDTKSGGETSGRGTSGRGTSGDRLQQPLNQTGKGEAETFPDGPEGVSERQGDRLLDGATGADSSVLLDQLKDLRLVAADPARDLSDRISAYEVIIDSEVGDTNMTRARNLEREVGLRQIYLKFEGGNPTGTQKDRIAFAQSMDALRRGFDTMTLATCGNYGAAMGLAASLAGLRCIVFIPAGYHSRRLEEITRLGAEIVRVDGDYEQAVLESSAVAAKKEYYDANPGGSNTALQLSVYGQISFEIYDELRDAPFAVAVPVSNGTTLTGIHRGFLSLDRRGRTSRIPRMVAGSSFRKNPIVESFLKNVPHCEDLDPEQIHESSVNEPLINWHSTDGDVALRAIRESGGWAANASDRRMSEISRLLRTTEGLHVLPASTAGLVALLQRHRESPFSADRYVIVLTGRKA